MSLLKLSYGSVISSASTGIAALLLIGGGTVHRQFSVPNDVEETTSPNVPFQSKKADQLRSTDLIIIDVRFTPLTSLFPSLGSEHA